MSSMENRHDQSLPRHPAPGRGAGPDEDSVSLVNALNVVLRWRKLVLLVPLLVAGAMVARAALNQEATYTASARFMPQSEGGVTGALAGQLGGGGGGMQSPAFYSSLLTSRELLKTVVEQEYEIEVDGQAATATLIDIYDVGGSTPEARRNAAARRLEGAVSTNTRGPGFVNLSVKAESPELAEQIAATLLDAVHRFNLETRQSQAAEEARFIAERLGDAETELFAAEDELKAFLQANRQFRNSPELVFEHDRLQRQVNIRQELFTSLARSLDRARMEQVRSTPLITVLEHPAGSARRNVSTRVRSIAFRGLVFGLVIALGLVFMLELLRRIRTEDRPDYREFNALKAEALADLRYPVRWIRPRAIASRTGSTEGESRNGSGR